MIRIPTEEDIPKIVELLGEYHSASKLFSGTTFNAERAAGMAEYKINDDECFMFMTDNGFVSCSISYWFTDQIIVTEDMLYANKPRDAVLLAKKWVQYSLDLGAEKLYTSSTAGYGASGYIKLMKKLDFKPIQDGVFLYYE